MKYFTPQLIEMGRSGDDDVLDEQDRLWGEASERYSQHLEQIRGRFPKGLRRLFNRYYLHDAVIQRMGQKDKVFLIELRLDTPPRSLVTLRYRLLRPAEVNKDALPPACRSKGPAVEWLYSEVEPLTREEVLSSPQASTWVKDQWLARGRELDPEASAKWPFWCHRALLSNGWELTLAFHDVDIEEYEDLLSRADANGQLTSREPSVPSA
jgi:hypothetical protein